MDDVLKILLFIAFFLLVGLAGYKLYGPLNEKIKEAQSGWSLLVFSLLLFSVLALLLVSGLYVFIEMYAFLMLP